MKTASIRKRYPVTASRMGTSHAAVSMQVTHPPDYVSAGGRVRRWKVNPMGESVWCIYGRTVKARVRRMDHIPENRRCLIQCWGTRSQMMEVHRLALRIWSDLPGGSEFAAMHRIAFPAVIELETTPTITKPEKKRKTSKPNE